MPMMLPFSMIGSAPAKIGQQPFQKGTDAGLALIGDRRKRLAVEREFLMLCADFLLAVGGFPVGNPGDHLADIDRVLLRHA